jgi:bla regulator protein BlaR1
MENILYNISQVLGITIIHSLWQGLLIYFLLKVVLMLVRNLSSAEKYMLAVSSLLAITVWFGYTLVSEIQVYDWLAQPENLTNMPLLLELPANLHNLKVQTTRYYYSIEGYLPYITVLYIAGLMLNAGRIVLARRKINTIRQTMSLDVQLQRQINRFAQKFEITKKVKVALSRLVDVPCIVGYAKPVILLPFTLSTYLEANEIEAILMHELAHIKRNDYLINLAQQVVTTLLFFNPCVLLINKIIGEERENSCDDMVVDATQNPVIYAKALFKLEQNRQNELQLALAVTGKKYHLLNRIERIMKTKKQTTSIRPTLVAMLVLSLSVGSLALLNPEIAQGKISVKAIKPAITEMLADTIVKKKANAPVKTQKVVVKNKVQKLKQYQYHYGEGNVYYTDGLKDPELEKLTAQINKRAELVNKYYDSDKFKAVSAEMEKRGKEMQAFYDNPGLKELTARQEKMGAEMEKVYSAQSAGTEELSKKMEASGKAIEKYYSSPEFKEMNAKLEKKYGITHNNSYNSRDENYRKYQEEVQKYVPAEVKQQTDQIRKLGEQMRSKYSTPDMKAQADQMRKLGDSVRKAFANPAIKAQQAEMRKLGDQMRTFTANPDIKRQQDLLKQASNRLKAYTHTPEFKAKIQEWKKLNKEYRWISDSKTEVPEVEEVPAAPAPPEAVEAIKEVPAKP